MANLKYLFEQLDEACSKFLATEDSGERNCYFGMMLGLRGGAHCFLKGGTQNPTYVKMDAMIKAAIAKHRAA